MHRINVENTSSVKVVNIDATEFFERINNNKNTVVDAKESLTGYLDGMRPL